MGFNWGKAALGFATGGVGLGLLGGAGGAKDLGKVFRSSKGIDTTTSENNPWSPAVPGLKNAVDYTQNWWDNRPQRMADFAPEQNQAFSFLGNRASNGNQYTNAGGRTLLDTINGRYITPESNPFLGAYVNKAFESTLPQYDTSATDAGRYGSNAWATMKGRAMGDIASNIYGNAYNMERGNQMNALPMALNYSSNDLNDINNLLKVGEMRQNLAQENQNLPMKQIEDYTNLMRMIGGMGGTGTMNTPYYRKAPIYDIIGAASSMAGAAGKAGMLGA